MTTTADAVTALKRRRARSTLAVPRVDQSVGRLLRRSRPAPQGSRAPVPEGRDCPSSVFTAEAVARLISHLIAQQRRSAQSWQDPVRTLREMDALATHLAANLADLQADLPHAVRTLRRQGLSFKEIAAETGIPLGRVIELARQSRALGLTR